MVALDQRTLRYAVIAVDSQPITHGNESEHDDDNDDDEDEITAPQIV
jgi:hypothetical protein